MTHHHHRHYRNAFTAEELNHLNRQYYGADVPSLSQEITALRQDNTNLRHALRKRDEDLLRHREDLRRTNEVLLERDGQLRRRDEQIRRDNEQIRRDGHLIRGLKTRKDEAEAQCAQLLNSYNRVKEVLRVERERWTGGGYRHRAKF